jgi:D-xylose transport system substrate-binding protein
MRRNVKWTVAAAITALGIAACGSPHTGSTAAGSSASGSSTAGSSTSSSQLSGDVYFLVPDASTPRWLTQDTPLFTSDLKKLAPNLHVIVENSNDSVTDQQSEVEDAITKGAKAIMLVSDDPDEATGALVSAQQAGIPVIAYDHNTQNGPLAGFDVYNSVTVGQLQAQPACQYLSQGAPKTLARIMGNPGEYGTTRYYQGQNECLNPLIKSGQVKIVCSQYTPNWDPTDAQQEAEACLTKTNDKVSAFLDMNDGTSGGVIAALQAQHLAGKVPVYGGQDADLQNLQYIAEGYQAGTIFKSFVTEASIGAQMAVAAIEHKSPLPGVNGTYNNGYANIPTALLTPTYVNASTLGNVVTAGIYTWSQICSGPAAGTSVCKSQ